jgi:ADP-ribose pyrophosphatase
MMPVQTLHVGKFVSLVKRGTWEYASRNGLTGIIAILAVTDENKVLLVEQFRPPVNKRVIEIPAGLAGDLPGSENEDLAIAAARELEEETGYRAAKMEMLTSGAASAGICDEIITLYRASGLTKVGAGGGDAHENIEVHEVPVGEVEQFLTEKHRTGVIVDLKVYSALYFVGSTPRTIPCATTTR